MPSLYEFAGGEDALHRLEQQGWIRAEWADSDLGRSAKFYTLTGAGRRQLRVETKSWTRYAHAVLAALLFMST